jgi:hypothetical protein
LDFEVVEPISLQKDGTEYFNSLVKLQNEVMFAVSSHPGGKNIAVIRRPGYTTRINEKQAIISPQYSYLAEKYGTPYFSFVGIDCAKSPFSILNVLLYILGGGLPLHAFLGGNHQTIFYNIVVNVITGEIVYRETRRGSYPVSYTNLHATVYDSFNIFFYTFRQKK